MYLLYGIDVMIENGSPVSSFKQGSDEFFKNYKNFDLNFHKKKSYEFPNLGF